MDIERLIFQDIGAGFGGGGGLDPNRDPFELELFYNGGHGLGGGHNGFLSRAINFNLHQR